MREILRLEVILYFNNKYYFSNFYMVHLNGKWTYLLVILNGNLQSVNLDTTYLFFEKIYRRQKLNLELLKADVEKEVFFIESETYRLSAYREMI